MKVDWQKIEYIHKSGQLYEAKCKDESFTLNNYKESFKGLPKNAGFFHFIITKGCDIRYYINNHKIKEEDREEFSKNKFKLTLFGNFDILNPKRKIDFGAGLNQNIIGGYNSIADAMNVAQSICEGLIESLITGKPNNNFSRESKKLLIEKKDDVIFTRNRVNNDRAIERK